MEGDIGEDRRSVNEKSFNPRPRMEFVGMKTMSYARLWTTCWFLPKKPVREVYFIDI
jgi:hypothetical protein